MITSEMYGLFLNNYGYHDLVCVSSDKQALIELCRQKKYVLLSVAAAKLADLAERPNHVIEEVSVIMTDKYDAAELDVYIKTIKTLEAELDVYIKTLGAEHDRSVLVVRCVTVVIMVAVVLAVMWGRVA